MRSDAEIDRDLEGMTSACQKQSQGCTFPTCACSRNVTTREDRMLRNAAKRSAKVVAPGKLKPASGVRANSETSSKTRNEDTK